MDTTAQAIRGLRKQAKLTRREVAERSGFSESWIVRLESDKHETTWNGIKDVACDLGVTLTGLTREIERLERESET
jgi:transcriptional regulator with XRE-family HTH domain